MMILLFLCSQIRLNEFHPILKSTDTKIYTKVSVF